MSSSPVKAMAALTISLLLVVVPAARSRRALVAALIRGAGDGCAQGWVPGGRPAAGAVQSPTAASECRSSMAPAIRRIIARLTSEGWKDGCSRARPRVYTYAQ